MNSRFTNRREAGRLLAEKLSHYAGRSDVLVLALPRGGIPVACEVAQQLSVPLDILMVHKLSAPHAATGSALRSMGAIASRGCRIIDDQVVRDLHIPHHYVEHSAREGMAELIRREHSYRGVMFGPQLRGRVVLLVDDGVATGATMRAAIRSARSQEPARLVVAVPIVPSALCEILRRESDELISLCNPDPFLSIAACYDDFSHCTDHDAQHLLRDFMSSGGHLDAVGGVVKGGICVP